MDEEEQRRRRDACPHCDPEHGDPRQKSWAVRVGPWVDGDDRPTYLLVQPIDGAHVAQSDAEWLWKLIRDHGVPQSDLPEAGLISKSNPMEAQTLLDIGHRIMDRARAFGRGDEA